MYPVLSLEIFEGIAMKLGRVTVKNDFNQESTSFTKIAVGNTSERPENRESMGLLANEDAAQGMLRYNSDIKRYEGFFPKPSHPQGGEWRNLITEKNLTDSTGITPSPDENVTKLILSDILSKMSRVVYGSMVVSTIYSTVNVIGANGMPIITGYNWMGRPIYKTEKKFTLVPEYGTTSSQLGPLPSWISNMKGPIESYTSKIMDTNFITTCGSSSIVCDIDILKVANLPESYRHDYIYDAMSCIFHVQSVTNRQNFIHSTSMNPIWNEANKDKDKNYGKFRFRLSNNNSIATIVGARWFATMYRYKNFL